MLLYAWNVELHVYVHVSTIIHCIITNACLTTISSCDDPLPFLYFLLLRQDSNGREREVMSRQHEEDKEEQKRSEARMNRWYNRLLNRHQDDAVSIYMYVTML